MVLNDYPCLLELGCLWAPKGVTILFCKSNCLRTAFNTPSTFPTNTMTSLDWLDPLLLTVCLSKGLQEWSSMYINKTIPDQLFCCDRWKYKLILIQ